MHRLCVLGLLPGDDRPWTLRRSCLFPGCEGRVPRAAGEDDVLDLWDRRTGFVQEIWSCREFEARPAEGAGTGHRGAFPLELA